MEYNIKISDMLEKNKYIQLYFIKESKVLLIMLNCFKLTDVSTFNIYDSKIVILMNNDYVVEQTLDSNDKILIKKAEKIFLSIPDKNISSININELPKERKK